jgi:hypothetical protein
MMVMLMSVTVAVTTIGAPHRGKLRHDLPDIGPQLAQHVFDDVVALDQDMIVVDLSRQMPVAKVPSENCQGQTGGGAHFQQWLFGCNDFDVAAVFKNETIPMRQRPDSGKIHQDAFAALQRQHLASHMAFVVRHDERVAGRRVLALSDLGDADKILGHGVSQNRK